MKLGFSTVADVNATVEEVISAAKENGFSTVEVRLDGYNRFFGYTDIEDVKRCAKAFADAGITVSDLGASITVSGYDKEAVDTAERVMQYARITGAKGFRVFLAPFYKKHSERPPHDHGGIVKTLKEMAALAEKTGVEVWIETHNAYSSGKVLRSLLDEIGSDKVKIIWDLMHPFELGESPADTARYLGASIAHVHIKDGVKFDDPDVATLKYTPLGEGIVPVRESLEVLKSMGYDGVLSLEWEKAWRAEIVNVYPNLSSTLKAYREYMEKIAKDII